MTPELSRLRWDAQHCGPEVKAFTAGEVKSVFDHLAEVEKLSEARWALLREWAKGLACEDPDHYGRDCGHCMRCRSMYREGALAEVETVLV